MKKSQLEIVVPLFNEQECLPELLRRLEESASKLPDLMAVRYIFVDDGSSDHTWRVISDAAKHNPRISGIRLSRNFGHQAAILAGLAQASESEAVIIMDGDLQDPPEMIPELWGQFQKGHDVVYAIRKSRECSLVLGICYKLYYRLLNYLASVEIPMDAGDFCLVSNRVAQLLVKMPERQKFVRGLRAWVGFSQVAIEYNRPERLAGSSKYSFKKLFLLASSGILSFSAFPLRLAGLIGFFAVILSTLFSLYCVLVKLIYNTSPTGFTAIMLGMVFLSGIQLLVLGIIGEYLGRVYEEQKQRPAYIDRETINLTPREIIA